MKIVFAGTPAFAAKALQRLIQEKMEIVAVYTQPDRPSGRGQKLTASEVKQIAQEAQIPVYQPLNFKASTPEGEAAILELMALKPDIMIVAAYGLILPQQVLDIPTYGCLNIHASILPRWRGAAPIHRALLNGDKKTGITIMQMNAGLDTGDMLHIVETPITADDSTPLLHDRLSDIGADAITTVLKDLTLFQSKATPQSNQNATYAHKLTKQEGLIDWQQNASEILRKIKALQPWPVAYTNLHETVIRVWDAMPTSGESPLLAGSIVDITREGVIVSCGDQQLLKLTLLQWPNGSKMNAQQIWQSHKLQKGDQFN